MELVRKANVEETIRKRKGTTSETEQKTKTSKENSASANTEDAQRAVTSVVHVPKPLL